MRQSYALLCAAAFAAGCLPPPAGTPADPKSVAVYDVARDEFQKGNFRHSLAKVQESLELDSRNADAAYLGAIIHLAFCAKDEAGADCRLEDAEKFARRALNASPEMRDARNTLGVVLVHQKNHKEAIEILSPLTEDILYNSPEKSWGNLGWAYLEDGQLDKAIDALRRAVASQPAFCVGNHRLGLAYTQQGDSQAAREAFTRALETEKGGCSRIQAAWEGRAVALAKLKQLGDARADLRRCVDLGPTNDIGKRCASQLKQLGPDASPAVVEAAPPETVASPAG